MEFLEGEKQIVKQEERNAKFYLRLFWATFSLSAFTFGGGYVIVPLMRKKFVDKLGWISEEEMLNYVAIAQASPGPIAVNTSLLVGYHMAGFPGAMLTLLGTILPPLVVISGISLLYNAFRDNAVIQALMFGMRIGVAAVLVDVVITMAQNIVKTKNWLSIGIMLVSFVLVYFLQVHIMLVLLACILIGIIRTLWKTKNAGVDT